ncbi:Uma2 family endonuclease [Limnothrix sp. FACHB-708]|uniref:Uma2 family endonuclease n=1 Tax=unclassified Limnothrix TaxID=2632864 RepID=UPI001683ACB8|nr:MULTISPECIES: Uma2 family endonuclease [unclassified Limnothrix]MBD2552971.1 Uma2 family endonuclease [Limnothrix sp. FACHB-708]MBD2589217.1 Uma2 family endonuclease [Limnothrix sp. FACHB-406]
MPASLPQSTIQLESINHSSSIILDYWQRGTWEEFIAIAQQTNPDNCQNSRGYYYNGWMRLEPTRSGADQARSHAMVASLVGLYAALAPMKLADYVNPIIQRCQQQQAQPHLAFYIDRDLKDLPTGNVPIDLDRFDPPSLVVEVGASSFADDVGMKRLLYERLGVAEYWVVNVEARSIIGFAIADRGSREIQVSQVLPGLELSIITEALQRLDREDDGQITRWLIDQFQEKS